MKSLEEIKDEVCWDHGYISYENFKKELKNPDSTSHKELNTVMLEIARRYAREAESCYDVNHELEDRVASLEEELEDLADDNTDLEYENDKLKKYITELEDTISELRIDIK